ncbi:MAG: HAMP domain-containing protein [Planctomycetota bacterium]|nr:MAG: HAMP domain-containing protein [Planctomycetota bacterium]
MNRLLFRLWMMALFAFVIVLAIHEMVLVYVLYSKQDVEYVETGLGGGYRVVAEILAETAPSEQEARMQEMSDWMGISLELIDGEALEPHLLQRLQERPVIIEVVDADSGRLITPVPGTDQFLRSGLLFDVPRVFRLRHIVVTLLAGILFSIVFWWQIRPLRRQHRILEDAALSMAAGDRDIRIDPAELSTAEPLAHAFNHMAEKTQARVDAQQRLLRSISHELRTPISRLRIGIHLLERPQPEVDRKREIQQLDQDLEELNLLVDELLTYARFEGDAAPTPKEPVQVRQLLLELAEKFQGDEKTCGPASSWKKLPETFPLAPRFFRRAVENLLRNALRHAECKVEIEAYQEGGALVVEVHDDGPGIPIEQREAVFEPFFRLPEEQTSPGYGMGLAIVRQIVSWHQGEAKVLDSPLGGSCFQTRWRAEDESWRP